MTAQDQLRLRCSLKELNGLWYVRFSWYDSEGKRKQTNLSTGLTIVGNKHRAEVKMQSLYKELESKLLLDTVEANKIQFADWLKKWLDYTESRVSPSTYYSYKIVVERHIIPFFKSKGMTLAELTPKKIEAYFEDRMRNSDVSANTLKHENTYIHSSLKYAVIEGVLQHNPSDGVRIPKVQRHIANTFTVDQLKTFLSAIKGTAYEPAIMLAALLGLRRGEIAGMKWDCIDFENLTISVRGTVKTQGKEGYSVYYTPSAKNNTSIRTLPLSVEQAEYFKSIKNFQKHRQLKQEYCHEWDAFVCTYSDGRLITPSTLTRIVPKLCIDCGLPRLKLHELRHTFASLGIQNGISISEMSEFLGHSTPATTQNTYYHVDTHAKDRISKTFKELIY